MMRLIDRIVYGSPTRYSEIFQEWDTVHIVDHGLCDQDGTLFDYDLYTQTQNRLVATYGKVYRTLSGESNEIAAEPHYRYASTENLRVDATAVEKEFEDRFIECYGTDALDCLQKEYAILSPKGTNLYLDYVVEYKDGRIVAIEENGVTYHHPMLIGEERYRHQLEKQNMCADLGIKLYRFSSMDCRFPDRINEEIKAYFGDKQDFRPKALSAERAIKLYDYQKLELDDLQRLRTEHPDSATALIVLAPAAGKTMIILEDLQRLYQQNKDLHVLCVAPSKEVARKWKEEFTTRGFPESFVAGTYHLLWEEMKSKAPSYYDYMIIDEAHHAVAPMTSRALQYYTPKMLVGLTATPERLDGVRLETIFGKYDVQLSLEQAMERQVVATMYAYRLVTDIDLSNLRYQGRDYVNADLEKGIVIDSRDRVIVETVKRYFPVSSLHGVVFCINIAHAERLSKLFKEAGIQAEAISSKTRHPEKVLQEFSERKTSILCSCAMLNEGWNDTEVNLLVMARPTLSKALYIQQLGRGLRKSITKKALYVLDVVDQYGAILKPWSLHSVLGFQSYVPFAPVKQHYTTGEAFDLFGYHENVTAIEQIDIGTFENNYKDYLSLEQSARFLFINTGSLTSWIKKGEAKADLRLPFGSKQLCFFKQGTLETIRKEKQLPEHSDSTIKEDFFAFIKENQFTFSFKIVFLLSLLDAIDINGDAEIDQVLTTYTAFYQERLKNHLPVDRKECVYDEQHLSDKAGMKRSMLENPFEKFERKRFLFYGKDIAMFSFNPILWTALTQEDKSEIRTIMQGHLQRYYASLGGLNAETPWK